MKRLIFSIAIIAILTSNAYSLTIEHQSVEDLQKQADFIITGKIWVQL